MYLGIYEPQAVQNGLDVAQAEAFVESFRNVPVDEAEVAMLREMIYRVVKVEYRHMIETGELPRHSLAALHLERSCDVCLDSTDQPIHDYKALKRDLGGTMLDRLTDDCFKCLDSCLGADCTLDNRLHYALAYKRHETAFSRSAEINW